MLVADVTDCRAGTTAEGQNLLANISTSKASLLLLADKFCPSAVVPALNQFGFIIHTSTAAFETAA